jgi:hypothetical protein
MQSDKDTKEMRTPEKFEYLFRLLFALFFVFLPYAVFPQVSGTCAENLKNAQSFFEKGQVEQVPALLQECLKSGFKKEEELSAYKLLIQTFLLDDKLEKADSTMFAFLAKNPEYQTSPTDHSSFVYLYNSFIVKPVVQIGIHAGTNVPFLTFVEENPTAGEPGKSVYNNNAANLFFSLDAKFKVGKKLELGIEAGYSLLKFTNVVDYMEFGRINYAEVQQRLEIPVYISYDIKSIGKFTPYGRIGIGAAYNLSTTADVSFNTTDINNQNSRTGQTLNRKDSRVPLDIFGQIAAGTKYKIPHGYLFAEVRSDFGIRNQNVPGGNTSDLLENYYFWSDPGFRINYLNLNIGYTYVLYKPSKRKE